MNFIQSSSTEQLAIDETPKLIRLAYRILGSIEDAEEVVQGALLEMLTKFPALEKLNNPAGFLRHLVTCRSLDMLRKRRPTMPLKFDPPSLPDSQPDSVLVAQEWSLRLRAALARLSARKAEVFVLRYLSNIPNFQIAERLGISENAVAVTLRKARIELQSTLEKE